MSAPRVASGKVIGTVMVRSSPLRREERVRRHADDDVEVAGRPAVLAGTAAALQPDALAVVDARRGCAP